MTTTSTATSTTTATTTRGNSTGRVFRLGQPWQGFGPFLFASRLTDTYPRATQDMAPDASLAGHPLGNDFRNPAGWSMYHGTEIPGFPAHPHRGFETITVAERGVVDHADSTGATARFGGGDVQWVTAGGGVSHGEMFPLLDREAENPFELFQIWLNLPASAKTVDPEFTMQWRENIPVVESTGPGGGRARVRIVAGAFGDTEPLSPPVNSWAARATSDVAVWLIDLEPHARVELPAPREEAAHRAVYVYATDGSAAVAGHEVADGFGYEQTGRSSTVLETGEHGAKAIVLQAVPIGEPVVTYGPFVMNTEAEIREAFADYQRTEFGGWPWPSTAMVHPRETARFAVHGDGRRETPGQAGIALGKAAALVTAEDERGLDTGHSGPA